MATIQTGVASSSELFVDSSGVARAALFDAAGVRQGKLSGSASLSTDEALLIAGVNDVSIRHLRVDRSGNLGLNTNTVLLTDQFEGTTTPTNRWTNINTAMSIAQTASAGVQLNSALITTVTTGFLFRSLKAFVKLQKAPLHVKMRARLAYSSNSVQELGIGDATTFNGAHTNGAYWQITAGGVLQPVLTFNGVDTTGTAVTGLDPARYYTFDIILDDDVVLFTIQDTTTGLIFAERKMFLASTQPKLLASTRVFAFARVYNTASAPSTAPTLFLSSVDVVMLDAITNKTWKEQLAGCGYGATLSPTAFTSTANWTNNTAPSNATLSNTTAGYSTLGGLFSFAAVANAATDYCLFGFQVPSPYSFICTGIDIETWNTGAAVATTPTLLVWGLAHDLNAVSLASTGPRFAIGSQDLPVGAAIGARALRISQNFDVPIPTNAGRFLDVILRMPVATATASQVIQGMVTLRGYYE